MNLVQINERLKDLPMQAIQQYANGMNPEVPPYLALGELKRRELSQKQMANQGGAQGPQPSVKEQIEQKAGLMALQQMQQQQAQPQPQGPMPVPAGAPQPEAQPEPVMEAARGGLASVPVKFDFAQGGIVAFDSGGAVDSARATAKAARERLQTYGLAQRRNDPEGFEKAKAAVAAATARLQAVESAYAQEMSESGMDRAVQTSRMPTPPAAPAAKPEPAKPAPFEQASLRGMDARMMQSMPPAEKKPPPAGPAGPRPTGPAQAPQPAAAAPAQPDPNSMDAMLRAQMAKAPKERTLEDELAEQKAARAGAGMGDAAGLAQLERIRKMQEQYESSKPSGLQDLIRVFGQAGQYKGLSGLAPAYTANQTEKRKQDLDMAQKINEMMSGVETTQRGEQKDVASGALGALGTGRASAAAREKDLMQVMSKGRGDDMTFSSNEAQRKTMERGQDLNYKAAMAQVNATAARNNMELTANQRAGIADKAIDNVTKLIEKNPKLQSQIGKDPTVLQSMVKAETDRLMSAASGTTMPAAPGAPRPGGTSLKYNPATGKIE
jgi:hypothetical protein